MTTKARTKARTKTVAAPAPATPPAPPAPAAPDPALDDIAALLEAPEAFRDWLQSRPPDEPLTLPGAAATLAGYWNDNLYHPVSAWLRAIGGRRIWCEGGRWRLLGSFGWRDQPDWLRRFLDRCDPLKNDRLRQWLSEWRAAGAGDYPTPSRVVWILEPILGTTKP